VPLAVPRITAAGLIKPPAGYSRGK
jgi:hypothetical protein